MCGKLTDMVSSQNISRGNKIHSAPQRFHTIGDTIARLALPCLLQLHLTQVRVD